MIPFMVTKFDVVAASASLFAAGILAIPAMATFLDIKVCEFALHANLIDRFIMENYEHPQIVPKWEGVKWSLHSGLVIVRSLSTLLVTALPTCMIGLLAGIAIHRIGSNDLSTALEIGDVPK